MADRGAFVTGSVSIVELVDACRSWRLRCTEAFEVTGRWATSLSNADDQRLFAEASHRHAWHADLWRRRTPAIPLDDTETARADRWDPADDGARSRYHEHVGTMIDDLDALSRRVDRDLDAPTIRTITLVRADLVDLWERSA